MSGASEKNWASSVTYVIGDKGHEHERTGELTVKAALATAAKAAATETLVEKSILIYVVVGGCSM